MHSLEKRPTEPRTRRSMAALAALVALSALVASGTPSSAFGTNALPQAAQKEERSVFHRHFYRGVPYQAPSSRAEAADVTTVAADQDESEAAMAYCIGRFKSYDPSTGTYLGYDGQEHACP